MELLCRDDGIGDRGRPPPGQYLAARNLKFGSNAERTIKDGFDDAFGLFDDDRDGPASDARTGGTVYGAEAAAYRLFKLDTTATLADIKARFKDLSKLHHPDANGGDKGAEERFKKINDAYNTLVATF